MKGNGANYQKSLVTMYDYFLNINYYKIEDNFVIPEQPTLVTLHTMIKNYFSGH